MKSAPHKENIRACFNKAANTYDAFSEVQQTIGSHLITRLKKQQKQANIIADIGCGSGKVTQQFADVIYHQQLIAIDFAERLLAKAKMKLIHNNIKFLHADFDEINAFQETFDIIFANMSLQWSVDFIKTITHLKNALTPNGLLVFSLPLTDTFKELNQKRNHFLSTLNVIEALNLLNFQIEDVHDEEIIKAYPSKLHALKTIKACGAHYLFTPQDKQFIAHLKIKQIFTLTYHIGYFIGRKSPCP